jgi:hypothetical protein
MSRSGGFDEFYQASYGRLVGQLFPITGSLPEAEEVVQEAFVRAVFSPEGGTRTILDRRIPLTVTVLDAAGQTICTTTVDPNGCG